MAHAVVHYFPGGTREQYEASITAVHPSRTQLPEGQIYHASGPTEDGWVIFAVHDTKESWERFRDNVLLPALGAGVEGGFPTPPREDTFDVYNEQKG